ncbi:hypothetical protein GCM10009727_58540 [Actinomadura napierensis]|uniref:Uncharacterized protein n=1 Tax=Actinomadura napierensis TaxID=267854 RepID=A0ABP5LXH0_9ACTN
MRSITARMFVTLDDVVQGLGRPDEDTRNGLAHGGWAAVQRGGHEARTGQGMSKPVDMLFGRRTWEDATREEEL